MSAGAFEKNIYETNAGNFAAIVIQPETEDAVINTVPNNGGAGPVNQEASVRVNAGKSANGIIARTVTFAWTGDPPTGYLEGGRVTIPALTPAFYNACNPNDPASTGTYLGAGVSVVGRSPERVN
jgi:hypothetical protein